jgi:ariadne-1
MEVDFKVPAPRKKSYEIDHDSLSKAAVEKLMQSDVDHCCGILGVDVSNVKAFSGAVSRVF